jgi:hypothetical protein
MMSKNCASDLESLWRMLKELERFWIYFSGIWQDLRRNNNTDPWNFLVGNEDPMEMEEYLNEKRKPQPQVLRHMPAQFIGGR